MKNWAIILLSGSLLLPCLARAEEPGPVVCFPSSEARQMLVPLEQAPQKDAQIAALNEQVSGLMQENAALEKQNGLLKENNTLLKEQVSQVKELLQIQRDSYEGIIKATRPNPIKEFIDRVGFVGIGALIGMALLL